MTAVQFEGLSFGRRIAIVLLPFGAGFYLGYLYRSINAIIADRLMYELGLGPAQLGVLTSAYFATMAAAQIPVGVALDRYGPRRVQCACLCIAACGSSLYAVSDGFLGLLIGRALIGWGIGVAFMSSVKAVALWFPQERQATLNGWLIAAGALGAVTATGPTETLAIAFGWRPLFIALALATLTLALVTMLVVPEAISNRQNRRLAHDLGAIVRDPRFIRLAPLSALCIGTAWSLQSLWAAAWLTHVEQLSRASVVEHLLVIALALGGGGLALGRAADRCRARGIPLETLLLSIAAVSIGCQLALLTGAPVPTHGVWAILGAINAASVVSYAALSTFVPRSQIGQANGALNLLHVGTSFALQAGTGIVVGLWPAGVSGPPPEAYRAALGLTVALELAAIGWFAATAGWVRPTAFRAAQVGQSVGTTPANPIASPYARAMRVYSGRVAAAQQQARAWRLAAVGSGTLCIVLATQVMLLATSKVATPHMIEVGRVVTPAIALAGR